MVVSSIVSSRFEKVAQSSDREDIVYRDRGQLRLPKVFEISYTLIVMWLRLYRLRNCTTLTSVVSFGSMEKAPVKGNCSKRGAQV
jgi:hypothetical protein